MAVNSSDPAAQAYENNTTSSSFSSGVNNADIDGDDWTSGLAASGVENTDQIDGDAVWAANFQVTDEDATNYEDNSTASSWASGWGDASNWDV